jgi:hypothetical protein
MVLAPPTQKTRQNVMEVERKLVLVATSLSHSILPRSLKMQSTNPPPKSAARQLLRFDRIFPSSPNAH